MGGERQGADRVPAAAARAVAVPVDRAHWARCASFTAVACGWKP